MRFGIMAMQIDSLIPRGLRPQEAADHIAGFDHAALVEKLASHGFDLIELGGDLTLFMPHTFSPQAIERLAILKEVRGLSYTVHLPLWSVEPSTPLVPVRRGSVCALIECIAATRPLTPEVYVLHATGALAAEFYRMRLPETARAIILRHYFQNCARESLRAILTETGIPSRRLAIETVEFPFDLTLELAEELDLSICLDTGHVLAGFSGPIELFDALEQSLARLAEIHLHDCPWQGPERRIGYGLDHQPLGRGDLDVERLFGRLAEVGFNGPIIFELTVEEALASLEVVRATGQAGRVW
jgi:sugar phosphate isomerase/epimerase